jgi:hypothetical protein
MAKHSYKCVVEKPSMKPDIRSLFAFESLTTKHFSFEKKLVILDVAGMADGINHQPRLSYSEWNVIDSFELNRTHDECDGVSAELTPADIMALRVTCDVEGNNCSFHGLTIERKGNDVFFMGDEICDNCGCSGPTTTWVMRVPVKKLVEFLESLDV